MNGFEVCESTCYPLCGTNEVRDSTTCGCVCGTGFEPDDEGNCISPPGSRCTSEQVYCADRDECVNPCLGNQARLTECGECVCIEIGK